VTNDTVLNCIVSSVMWNSV